MKEFSSTLDYFTSSAFIGSAIVIALTVLAMGAIKKYLIKKVAYTTKDEQHKNTFVGVIFNLLQYLVVLICVVLVLKFHGVNITSIVAGLGIVATLVGLALQDTLKDVISGVNIYSNNFYKVGDLVMYNGKLCEVKYFSARVTKFQALMNNSTFTVCNSTINSIEKVKDITNIPLTFDFDVDAKKVEKCYFEALEAIKDEKYLKGFDYYGVVNVTTDGVVYQADIIAPGHKVWPIKLKYYEALMKSLKKAKISPSFSDEHKIKTIKNK